MVAGVPALPTLIAAILFVRGRIDRPAGVLLLFGYAAYWGANYLL